MIYKYLSNWGNSVIAVTNERIKTQDNLATANSLKGTSDLKINNLDKLLFFIVLFDTLFFPYIRVASASISMILLPIWYIFSLNKIRLTREFRLFILLTFFVILSISISASSFSGFMFLKPNITNSVILLYGFLYYFFYKYYFEVSQKSIKKVLTLYIMFGATLSVVYLANPSLYFTLRSFWTMSGNVIEVNDSLTIHRFTSTFSDPNNAAVAFVAVLTFILLNQKTTILQGLFLIGATTLIVFSTMSSTGFILLSLSLLVYFIRLARVKKVFRIKRSSLFYLSVMCILSPLILWVILNFAGSDVAQMALDRVSESTTGSRTERWVELLEKENIFKHILYGMGGTVLVDGFIFKPHNGHLHLIYSYGMIVYTIFLYIFFRKRKNTSWYSYFFLIPFILGFTVNVGIYEIRFVTLLALLVAIYANSHLHRATIPRKSLNEKSG